MFSRLLGLVFSLACMIELHAQSAPLLYRTQWSLPNTYEEEIIEHVSRSVEKAKSLESKLSGQVFSETEDSKNWRDKNAPYSRYLYQINGVPYYHLLNNLCELPGASHLHVGLLTGNSFIAALFQNEDILGEHLGIDWFEECSEEIFISNSKKYLKNSIHFVDADCFNLKKTQLSDRLFDIYFYDADHTERGQEQAILYYDSLLAEVFILVIDDWNDATTRIATFRAFDKLNYEVLYQEVIGNEEKTQYVSVIHKIP